LGTTYWAIVDISGHVLLTMKALNRNRDFPKGCLMKGVRAAVRHEPAAPAPRGRAPAHNKGW
jgi:hypothetical protein